MCRKSFLVYLLFSAVLYPIPQKETEVTCSSSVSAKSHCSMIISTYRDFILASAYINRYKYSGSITIMKMWHICFALTKKLLKICWKGRRVTLELLKYYPGYNAATQTHMCLINVRLQKEGGPNHVPQGQEWKDWWLAYDSGLTGCVSVCVCV